MYKLRTQLSALRVFDAVCRAGSVTSAAKALHLTPGAVSQQVKLLEKELRLSLFRKEGRQLKPTDAGRSLSLRVADSFDRIEQALEELHQSPEGKRLRLKVTPTFAIKWLVPRLLGFYGRHADIDVEIATTSQGDDEQLEQAHIVVRLGFGDWRHVQFERLFDDELVPVCSPETAKSIQEPSDLLKLSLLHSMIRPDAWTIWFKSVGIQDATRPRGVTLQHGALCYQAASEGLGVALAQRAYIAEDVRSGRLVIPIDRTASTGAAYYIAFDPIRAESHVVRAFRTWIRSCL